MPVAGDKGSAKATAAELNEGLANGVRTASEQSLSELQWDCVRPMAHVQVLGIGRSQLWDVEYRGRQDKCSGLPPTLIDSTVQCQTAMQQRGAARYGQTQT